MELFVTTTYYFQTCALERPPCITMTAPTEFIISVASEFRWMSDAIARDSRPIRRHLAVQLRRSYVTELRGFNLLWFSFFYGLDFLEIPLILRFRDFSIRNLIFLPFRSFDFRDSSSHAYHGPILRGSVGRSSLRTTYGIVMSISDLDT